MSRPMGRLALGECADVFNGKTPSKADQREMGHPVLKIKDVDESGAFRGVFDSFVEEEYAAAFSTKKVMAGDTLILNAAHNADYVGSKQFLASQNTEGALATGEWLIVRPDTKKVDAGFAHYWLTADHARRQIREMVKGIHLYPKDVARLKIPLPPLDEQRRIAAILDKADALRRKRKRARELLDGLPQSVFTEMFGDPTRNPKGWKRVALGDVIHKASDGPHVSPEYSETGIPFLSTRHVQRGMIRWDDLKYIDPEQAEVHWKKCRPERGDILYTKGGTTGLAAMVDTDDPFAVWVHVALLKLDFAAVEPLWLEAMLNSDYCYRQSQRYTHGIANRDLGLKRMVKIEMYLPSKLEQKRFVDAATHLRGLRSSVSQAMLSEESLFSSLQHRAFSGQL